VKRGPECPACVSRETRNRLEVYATLLLHWNRTINLISRRDEADLWPRHINDSLDLTRLLPSDFAFGADLGSGAGFPGLVLAIVTDRPFHLIEVDQRKAAFLREAARATNAPATVHSTRIEEWGISNIPLITARALAPLTTLLDWAAPRLASGGVCLFPKGRNHATELTTAATRWQMHVESIPSHSAPDAVILRIRDIQRVRTAT
jgi:16S rRNA (guanine527-N7)-methyltransferase